MSDRKAEHITRNSSNSNVRYRSKIEIIGKILEVAANHGGNYGTTKTKMTYAANVSYDVLQGYVELLIENDLLSYDKETHALQITEKGILFLQAYNGMDQILKDHHC